MISIIIPCYNHNQIVVKAVNSALSQQYDQPYEVILVDDGSDIPVVNQWDDPKFRIIRHPRNLGLSAALNTGISQSNGNRFVICAADDMLHPMYLKEMSAQVADIISCDMMTQRGVVKGRPGDWKTLARSNCHSYAALIDKQVWKAVGGYNIHMNPSWEDWEFFLHAAELGFRWKHVSKPLHIYLRAVNGRDVEAQDKTPLLQGLMRGFHPKTYGKGAGLVTFVIPCYNHAKFVAEAVESALYQTYPHVAVVVVDDGSPDNVKAAMRKFKDDERVALLRQENKHLSAARNTGIKYAIARWNTQYIVPLDADDTVNANFIIELMPKCEYARYAYSDVQFIGDANHQFQVDDYNCHKLAKKHLHACTILLDTYHWKRLAATRGFGYDESMKQGYEDWEFALALVKSGVCGVRVPKPLFNYRNHASGSMRTEATKINKQLVADIKKRQPWINNSQEVAMACSTCGKSRYATILSSGGGVVSYNIPGIGVVPATEPILTTYTGTQTSTITKIGSGGTIYKYSGNPAGTFGPTFTIFARDIHLFNGPYNFAKLNVIPQETIQPVMEVVAAVEEPVVFNEPGTVAIEDKLAASLDAEVVSYEPDDFTKLKWVGDVGAKKLTAAGFSYFEDIAEAAAGELASVLGISEAKAEEVITSANTLLDEL